MRVFLQNKFRRRACSIDKKRPAIVVAGRRQWCYEQKGNKTSARGMAVPVDDG
jgi:hypothetical protein